MGCGCDKDYFINSLKRDPETRLRNHSLLIRHARPLEGGDRLRYDVLGK